MTKFERRHANVAGDSPPVAVVALCNHFRPAFSEQIGVSSALSGTAPNPMPVLVAQPDEVFR
jgi:hypothetical protein